MPHPFSGLGGCENRTMFANEQPRPPGNRSARKVHSSSSPKARHGCTPSNAAHAVGLSTAVGSEPKTGVPRLFRLSVHVPRSARKCSFLRPNAVMPVKKTCSTKIQEYAHIINGETFLTANSNPRDSLHKWRAVVRSKEVFQRQRHIQGGGDGQTPLGSLSKHASALPPSARSLRCKACQGNPHPQKKR